MYTRWPVSVQSRIHLFWVRHRTIFFLFKIMFTSMFPHFWLYAHIFIDSYTFYTSLSHSKKKEIFFFMHYDPYLGLLNETRQKCTKNDIRWSFYIKKSVSFKLTIRLRLYGRESQRGSKLSLEICRQNGIMLEFLFHFFSISLVNRKKKRHKNK